MGIADDREMLEAAQRECVHLERVIADATKHLKFVLGDGAEFSVAYQILTGMRRPAAPREEQP